MKWSLPISSYLIAVFLSIHQSLYFLLIGHATFPSKYKQPFSAYIPLGISTTSYDNVSLKIGNNLIITELVSAYIIQKFGYALGISMGEDWNQTKVFFVFEIIMFYCLIWETNYKTIYPKINTSGVEIMSSIIWVRLWGQHLNIRI